MPLTPPQLQSRFAALDAFLLEHQALWRPRPFTHRHLPWESQHPELSRWLRQRSLEEAEAAHNHPEQLDAPKPFIQLALESTALSEIDALPLASLEAVSSRMSVDVPAASGNRSKPSPAA